MEAGALSPRRDTRDFLSETKSIFMPQPPSSADLRRWAAQCAGQAKLATADEQRQRLLKMEQAFLAAAAELDRVDPEKGNAPA